MRRADGESPEAGFTLIELLIVIVVLGILAAIVIFSLTGVTGQSKAAACNSDAKTVEIAVDAYNAENRHLPGQLDRTAGHRRRRVVRTFTQWPATQQRLHDHDRHDHGGTSS